MTDAIHEPTQESKAKLTKIRKNDYLPQEREFEPDRDLKETWLPLRKTLRPQWGIKYPGLFDYRASWDAGWFWVTVLLEIIVTLAIVTLLFLSGKIGIELAFAGVILNLLLDGVFAYLHHLSEHEYCIQKNRECLFFGGWKPGINSYSQHILSTETAYKNNPKVWFWRPFSTLLIWAFSLLKILFFLALYMGSDFYYELVEEQNNGLMAIGLAVLAVIAFIWIAVNHIYRTGYYLAYRWHNGRYKQAFSAYARALGADLKNQEAANIKRHYQAHQRTKTIDFLEFLNSSTQANVHELRHFMSDKETDEVFRACLKKGLIEKEVDGMHSLVRIQGQENTWELACEGMLMDEQLNKIVEVQPTELAKLAVAYFGHAIQMESVNL